MGGSAVTSDMCSAVEKKAKQIADSKQPYERVVVTKEECMALFEANPFKLSIIKCATCQIVTDSNGQ